MRKLGTREALEKKQKRSTIIISVLMLFILVASTVGFAFVYNPGSTDSFGNTESGVRNIGDYWVLNVGGENIGFSSSPDSTADIPVEITAKINDYFGSILYIVSDNEGVTQEIVSTIGRYADRIQLACYGECEEDLPEKDCSDNLIVWNQSIDNRVYQQEGCVFIEGDIRAVDAFLYRIFGVN